MAPKTKFQWRHQYDEDRDAKERAIALVGNEPSPLDATTTQQQYKDDTDLNVILKRYGVTDGAIPPMAADPRYYGDFSDAVEFREALDITRDATERFNALPAELRDRFHNDPVRLWDFVNNPKNDEESIKLGLLKRLPPNSQTAAPSPTPSPSPTGSGTSGQGTPNSGQPKA